MSYISNRYCDEAGLVFDSKEDSVLTILTLTSSSVGLLVSTVAFILLIVTAVLFKEWRKNRKNQLLTQFMFARILYTYMRYMYDVRNLFNLCEARCVIYLDVIGLVYTEYALICWMFIFSKHLNDSLVKVFKTSEGPLWKISLYTWLIPAVISGLLYIAFGRQNDNELAFYLLYLFILKWPLLFANAILLITALKAVIQTNKSKVENNVRIILVMIMLIFGFSAQQILIDIYKIVHLLLLEYYVTLYLNLINIVAIYYCAFSILFWLFGNAKTRELWRFKKPKVSTPSELSFRISVQS